MKYKNYNVLITGAASGIGLKIAEMFIHQGATVLAVDVDFDGIDINNEAYIPFKCDVTSAQELRKACKVIEERFDGKLDVMVNSAGKSVVQSVEEVSPEKFDYAVNLLLRPSVLLTSFCSKYFQDCDSKKPVTIYISSAASRSIVPDNILYGICKHALNYYTKQVAAGMPGIRAFSISPGTVKTPIFYRGSHADRTAEEVDVMLNALAQHIPVGRVAEPTEIGDLVDYLCSDEASYLSGSDFLIDGGIMTMFS